MAHYDNLDDEPVQTMGVPATMRAMETLGMRAMPTESHRWGVFEGYGVRLQIPSDMEVDVVGAMKLIVEQARAAGAEEQRKLVRKVLGLT
jgi:hypothetical protein